MCLSTVYVVRKEKEKELFRKNIAEINANGGALQLIDVLGISTVIHGEIININLVDNTIEIQPTKEA